MNIAPKVERKAVYGLVVNTRRDAMKIVMAGIVFLGLAAISGLVPVHAQPQGEPNCDRGRALVEIPTIDRDSQNNRLRGVIILADERRAMVSIGNDNQERCDWQDLRYFKGYSLNSETPDISWPSNGGMLPGPTLRARIGDQVQLAFFNEINTQNFPVSLDQAERGRTDGCDVSMASRKNDDTSRQIYPSYPSGLTRDGIAGDTMPNCLHGSSTANIHFHGTHTTPSTTGDNVLLYVRPAMRNAAGEIVDAEDNVIGPIADRVMKQIEEVWARCEVDGPPDYWDELPLAWRTDQTALLKKYDRTAPYKGVNGALPYDMQLWPKDSTNLAKGLWPQYSLGAFPYCYPLPDYADGEVEMGQVPGTQWYHAHKHGSTALNVGNGMSGAFIIEGPYDDELKAFYKKNGNNDLKEHVLVIQQLETALALMSAGPAVLFGNNNETKKKPPLSVNGRVNPIVEMQPGEVQMWRIVNASARTFVQFDHFTERGRGGNKVEWRQIAQDGVQFSYDNYKRVGTANNIFNMAAANRVDLLVKAPTHPADYALIVVPSVSNTPGDCKNTPMAKCDPVTLLTVRVVKGEDKYMDFITEEGFPVFPSFLKDIPSLEYGISRKLVYNTDPAPGRKGVGEMPQHKINGKQFDGSLINESMILGTTEEWTMVNKTFGIAHPFHIHINPFQIVEVFQPTSLAARRPGDCYANPYDPTTWNRCAKLKSPFVWWDTFAIPAARGDTLGGRIFTSAAGECKKNGTTWECPSVSCGTVVSEQPSATETRKVTWGECKIPEQDCDKVTNPECEMPERVLRNTICTLNVSGPGGSRAQSVCTVTIPGTFKMRSRFVDFTGVYVNHCHILAHEDRGMMQLIQVVPPVINPWDHN